MSNGLLEVHPLPRLWALVAVSYVTVLQALHILWTGHAAFSVATATKMVLIPSVQAAVLMWVAGKVGPRPAFDSHRVEWLFVSWLVLSATLLVANAAVEFLAVQRLDLTESAVLLLLAAPFAQAAAVMAPPRPVRQLVRLSRAVLTNGLAASVIWVDVAMFSVGWRFPDHPTLGIAAPDALQQWWMAIKLLAAAALLARLSTPASTAGPRDRRVLIFAATVFALLGIDGVRPGMSALSIGAADMVASPHVFLLRALARAAALTLVLTCVVLVRTVVSGEARTLVGAGGAAMLLAALALAMNGFLSVLPVYPWVAIATMAGSIGASLLLAGSVLAAKRR